VTGLQDEGEAARFLLGVLVGYLLREWAGRRRRRREQG
jgi:hypothetical protein